MIERLIRWSARNPYFVVLATGILAVAGAMALTHLGLDAIPDLTDTQVVITTDLPGQPAQLIEDQVTYPLASELLSLPGTRVVRAESVLGTSFVYVLFDDHTDRAEARTRVIERLAVAAKSLPPGAVPTLAPDATGLGWVYQYVLAVPGYDLAQLRGLEDWTVRNGLRGADGVAEIASLGGFVKNYSVVVDPHRLTALGLSLGDVREALKAGNIEVGGRSLDLAETEYVVSGRGWFHSKADIESAVVKADGGAPILIRDIGRVEIVGDERRGVAELDGEGEVVSGIAVQRTGGNALATIGNVKQAAASLVSALPSGATLEPIYDRSELIGRAIATLRTTLAKECVAVILVGLVFLGLLRSAIVPALLLPAAVAITLGLMALAGIPANIMSLGGIAVAVGAMVDAALVMVENADRRRAEAGGQVPIAETLAAAAAEVGPALFYSLLIITISFLPILGLEASEGRLFRPLALTKSLSMAVAALLSVTFVPALMVLLQGPEKAVLARPRLAVWLERIYRPVLALSLLHRRKVLLGALVLTAAGLWPALHIGSEFLPPLNEGAILYMPTAQPGLTITKATELLQIQDRILKSFPEVEHVLGKSGRADTATDPAPVEMFETTVILKPEDAWRPGMTYEKLVAEMDRAVQLPGIANEWTMPIRGRVEMLSTGLRTQLGVKIFGTDLAGLDKLSQSVADAVRVVPGTTSAYADRVMGGHSIDIIPDRERLARYGLTVADVDAVISSGIGAEPVTTLIEGRERYPVSVRLPNALRNTPEAIGNDVLVALPNKAGAVPLAAIATIKRTETPSTIRSENGRLVAYVYVDTQEADIGGYVSRAQAAIAAHVNIPPGYSMVWSGQYEHMQRAIQRMQLLAPFALGAIVLLLYHLFRRVREMALVLLSLPFALIGGLWLQYALGFNFSIASAVGFVALAGVATETGIVMLLYIDRAVAAAQSQCQSSGQRWIGDAVTAAVASAARERLRPKLMTVTAILAGLAPILWSHGVGAEYLQRIAVPMIGGMVSSTLLTLFVIPVLYSEILQRQIQRAARKPR